MIKQTPNIDVAIQRRRAQAPTTKDKTRLNFELAIQIYICCRGAKDELVAPYLSRLNVLLQVRNRIDNRLNQPGVESAATLAANARTRWRIERRIRRLHADIMSVNAELRRCSLHLMARVPR